MRSSIDIIESGVSHDGKKINNMFEMMIEHNDNNQNEINTNETKKYDVFGKSFEQRLQTNIPPNIHCNRMMILGKHFSHNTPPFRKLTYL